MMTATGLLAASDRLSRMAVWVGGIMIFGAAGLICVEVVLRKIWSISTGGTDELSGYALAIGASWSMAFTLLRRAHVRVDAAYARCGPTAQSWLDLIAILAMTLFAVLLAYFCSGVVTESIALDAQSTTTLSIPMWIPQGLWFAGLVVFALIGLILSVLSLNAILGGDREALRRMVGGRTTDEEIEAELGTHGGPANTGKGP